jgi:hypothetical protein
MTTSGSSQICTVVTQMGKDSSGAFDPLQELEGTRLRKVIQQKQDTFKQKVDKYSFILKQGQLLKPDWSIKSMVEINLAYKNPETLQNEKQI